MSISPPPPDRQCGPCTVCCEFTRIKTDELVVPTGVKCPHCAPGVGCTVYDRRPAACRDHLCGWRLFAEFPEEWRPDRCGFMIVFYPDDGPEFEIISLGTAEDLHRPRLADLIADWIRSGANVVLTRFGRPNELRAQIGLNDSLRPLLAEPTPDALFAVLDESLRQLREEHAWQRDEEVLATRIEIGS